MYWKPEARLHLSKRDAANYQNALDALAKGGFTSSANDATVAYEPNKAAPWYQYIEQRDDCEVNATYTDLLDTLNDPRISTLGAPQTNAHPVLTEDRRTPMLSYVEMKFIEAECLFQTQGPAAAHQAYLDGIAASFEENGMTGLYSNYVASNDVDPGAANLTLEHIMTQKYIALVYNPEVFADWRRTGIPALTPNTGTEIPRRLPYPNNETISNANTPSPADVTLFTPVWWDN